MELEVLYEDNHILVAVKPQNVPSMPDASGDMDMLTAVKAYVKEKYGKPGDVYIGLVHRLDRPTGGVMVFARTSKAAARLCKQFAEKSMAKEYLAVVRGTMDQAEGTLEHWLEKDEDENTVRTVQEGQGKRAELQYKTLQSKDGLSLLQIRLMTGRGHQIRVQLAAGGHPILGDMKYGRNERKGNLMLWAFKLTIEHPTKKESMTFTAMPQGKGWEMARGAV